MIKNKVSLFVLSLLVAGSFFIAFPETGNAQYICCQVSPDSCLDNSGDGTGVPCSSQANVFQNSLCGESTGQCISLTRNVPTLSEWGLIALAGVLAMIGLIAIHRRKATA